MPAPAAARRVDLSALNLPDGVTKPYRPKPPDFRETYLRIGWDGLEEHYHTNWRVVRRWIEEEGRDRLRADRAAVVERQREAHRRALRQRHAERLTAVSRARAAA